MLFVAEYEFGWDALPTVVAKRLEWDAAQPDGFRFVGEYIWQDREPPFRGVAVIEADDVEALNAFALHYGADAQDRDPRRHRRAVGHRHAAPRRRKRASSARQAPRAASAALAVAYRRSRMADATCASRLDGRRRSEPDRLSAAGRPHRVPQAERHRVQGHAERSAAARCLPAGGRRPPSAGGDDPRRRLGARRPLRDGSDASGPATSRPPASRWSRSTIAWRPADDVPRFVPGLPRRGRLGGGARRPARRRSAAHRPVGRFRRRPPRPAARDVADEPELRRSAPAHRRGALARRRGALSAHRSAGARPRRAARPASPASSATSSAPIPRTHPARWHDASPIEHGPRRASRRSSSCRARATCWCPHSQATSFAERLTAAGAPHRLEIVEGGLHGFDRIAPDERAIAR